MFQLSLLIPFYLLLVLSLVPFPSLSFGLDLDFFCEKSRSRPSFGSIHVRPVFYFSQLLPASVSGSNCKPFCSGSFFVYCVYFSHPDQILIARYLDKCFQIVCEKIFAKTFAAAKVKETRNLRFCTGESGCLMFHLCEMSNFACLELSQLQKVFVNIFSRNYYFTNNLEITLAGGGPYAVCISAFMMVYDFLIFSHYLGRSSAMFSIATISCRPIVTVRIVCIVFM